MWARSRTYLVFIITVFVLLVFWTLPSGTVRQESSTPLAASPDQSKNRENVKDWCPLPEKPATINDGLSPSFLIIGQEVVDLQVKRLSAAVNVPTVSVAGDGDVLTDPKYEVFHRFHEVLDDLFPLV
jgi:Gly-Xaa carboxypeptidase